jgi:hypothetical protein
MSYFRRKKMPLKKGYSKKPMSSNMKKGMKAGSSKKKTVKISVSMNKRPKK